MTRSEHKCNNREEKNTWSPECTKSIKTLDHFLGFRGFKFYEQKLHFTAVDGCFSRHERLQTPVSVKKPGDFSQVQTRIAAELGTSTGHFATQEVVFIHTRSRMPVYMS